MIITQWRRIFFGIILIVSTAIGIILPILLFGNDYYPLITIFPFALVFVLLICRPSTIVITDKSIRSLFKSLLQKPFFIKNEDINSVSICRLYAISDGASPHRVLEAQRLYVCELVIYLKDDESVGITLNNFSRKDEERILNYFRTKGFNLSLLEDIDNTKKDTKPITFYGRSSDLLLHIAEWAFAFMPLIITLIVILITSLYILFTVFVFFVVILIAIFAFNYDLMSNFKITLLNEYIISRRISIKSPTRAQDGWTINLKKVERISFEMFEYDYRGKHYKTNGKIYNMIHFHYRDGNSRYLIRTIFSKKQLFNLLDYCKKYKVIIEKPDKDPTIEKDWIFDYFTSDNEDKII